MKQDVVDVLNPRLEMNMDLPATRLDWDLARTQRVQSRRELYWKDRKAKYIPLDFLEKKEPIWLEIGAGTGGFFMDLAKNHPDKLFVAVERCKTRSKALVAKTLKSGLPNIRGIRGNAVPALMNGFPDNSVDRIYILYPCPFPKPSQRKNRWYLHAVMPHFLWILKPGGIFVWASDQEFYIDDAKRVCEEHYKTKILAHGVIKPNAYNHFNLFPGGRTKFEKGFLEAGQDCFELIVEK